MAVSAKHRAYVRRKYARYQRKKINEISELENFVIVCLKHGLSPEAISGRMRRLKKPWYASKTAIYEWLYSTYGQRYCRYLLTRRSGRRKRRSKKMKRQIIPHRISIDERSHRMGMYDYEGDTIVCSQSTTAIVTLHNPLTLYTDARRVPNLKPAVVARAFRDMLSAIRIRSLTLDNGLENRLHHTLHVQTYFCDPYSSWQKPGVENANRLIRRLVQKGSDIQRYSHARITSFIARLNNIPRKKLGWLTPNEVMRRKKLFTKKKPQ